MQDVRDGLLVQASAETLARLLAELQLFAKGGGKFAVHVGDVSCGGKTFMQPAEELRRAMRQYKQLLQKTLASWPVYHLPGNHDVTGPAGGTADWLSILGSPNAASLDGLTGGGAANYRELLEPGWQLLLLDSMSGLGLDRGGGQIGTAQMRWLESKLIESKRDGRSVILITHQASEAGLEHAWASDGWKNF